MRIAVLIAVIAAAVGCGTSAGAPAPTSPGATSRTSLTITYWAQGAEQGVSARWTLRCVPTAGTLPRAAAACRKLAGMTTPFAPIPADAMCTQQYGGPQVAIVAGTFRGKQLWVKLQNRNGCEIARFKNLSFLVPGYGSGGAA
ncbi:MAG TPA: SSI family serine proteinase inhibitor [Gaiellaceae bacterium]|nr:SSI family serine proteinase inhibitor [Gaiellaceae bacterium]